MKYLLDTNIVIDLFNGVDGVVQRLSEVEEFGVAVSSVSLAELYLGAEKSSNKVTNRNKIDSFTRAPRVDVLDFTKKIAREYGKLLYKLESKGVKLAELDTMIAATAKLNNLVIITRDKKHFKRLSRFGLKVEIV